MPPHRFQQVVGSDRILVEILVGGITGNEFHIRVRGEVKYHFNTGHRGIKGWYIKQIALDKLKSRRAKKPLYVLQPSTVEVVEDDDFVTARGERFREIRADAACAASNQSFHGKSGCVRRKLV